MARTDSSRKKEKGIRLHDPLDVRKQISRSTDRARPSCDIDRAVEVRESEDPANLSLATADPLVKGGKREGERVEDSSICRQNVSRRTGDVLRCDV